MITTFIYTHLECSSDGDLFTNMTFNKKGYWFNTLRTITTHNHQFVSS